MIGKYDSNYVRRLTIAALIAAVYVVVTLMFKPISYGTLQFRIAEVLNLLAFIDPLYGIGVILGCFISNLYSELGIIDVFVGVPATALAVFFITKTKHLFVATLWPTIFSGVLVGLELWYMFKTPLLLNIASVSIGQFVVVTCIGYPVFRYILSNERICAIIKPEKRTKQI